MACGLRAVRWDRQVSARRSLRDLGGPRGMAVAIPVAPRAKSPAGTNPYQSPCRPGPRRRGPGGTGPASSDRYFVSFRRIITQIRAMMMTSTSRKSGLLKKDFGVFRRRCRFFRRRCGRRRFHGYRLRRRFHGRFCDRFCGRSFGCDRFRLRSRCSSGWRGLGRERGIHGRRREDLRRAFGHDGRADLVARVQLGNGDNRVAPVQADTALVDFALREFVNPAGRGP